jgi:hypothetical protein
MKMESEKHRMDVHHSDLSGSKKARPNGATIDGIAVIDLLAYWRAGHGAKSA